MAYYQIWVRSNRYHGSEPLTYSAKPGLKNGQVVRVELNKQLVNGFVSGQAIKPAFKTKPIDLVYDTPRLAEYSLQLANWLKSYYPAPIGLLTGQLLPAGDLSRPFDRITGSELKTSHLPTLNDQQAKAFKQIKQSGSYLLYGITGSGKTRLYIEAALKSFQAGQSSIILTPEISLTTQLGNSFRQVFGHRVVVMHSRQTAKERLASWLTCLNSQRPLIVVGPRSALFAPLRKIGLVVLDEAHETAYKQEQVPQYLSSRVAAKLAELTESKLILGSATPLITDYYLALRLQRPILRLNSLALSKDRSVKVEVIDRRQRDQFSRSSYLSNRLIDAIKESLSQSSQVLLYLNRRGTARLVLCSVCGWQAICPICHSPLTYHGDRHILRCHACGFNQAVPANCPVCRSSDILYETAGTKAIADEVSLLFPTARIGRFDSDNIKSESLENRYDQLKNGTLNVLVGTQLIAKGLDLPYLSLAGVILADSNLYLPDYTASERTFQLLTQVIGRVGRGHRPGRAIVQTYQPDHPAIKYALKSDYDGFYESEIKDRHDYNFPPFTYLLKLTTARASRQMAETSARSLKEKICKKYAVKVLGPAPSFYEYRGGRHHYQLVVKAKDRHHLLKVMSELPSGWAADIDPVDLL